VYIFPLREVSLIRNWSRVLLNGINMIYFMNRKYYSLDYLRNDFSVDEIRCGTYDDVSFDYWCREIYR
jgi:hypothetical protein